MPESLTDAVRQFAGMHVLVLGDAMLDVYTVGETRRLCPEAPVPIVDVRFRHQMPGGAANTALNLRALGARVALLSVIGDDPEGRQLSQLLHERGIDTRDLVLDANRTTLVKHRVMSEGHVMVRFDQGTGSAISGSSEQALRTALEVLYPQCDAVIVSDYQYGILSEPILECLVDLQADSPRTLVIDSKDLSRYWPLRPTAVKPNFRQAQSLCGKSLTDADCRWQALLPHSSRLLDMSGADLVAVTLDRDGAVVFSRDDEPYRTYAQPAPSTATAGAGDTYLAALGLSLAAGADYRAAADIAAAASAIVVDKPHTACCTSDELLERLGDDAPVADRLSALMPIVEAHRRAGRRIVLTNGCFDILHRGHITYLQQAKALGDVLIVGVNSDDSIHRLKGPERPINSLEDRLRVLSALGCIDHLVAFDEDTPVALVEAIRPDVFVKGGDYTRETLPEAAVVEKYGGSVKILPFLSDRSTTRIISRICEVRSRLPEVVLSAAGSD